MSIQKEIGLKAENGEKLPLCLLRMRDGWSQEELAEKTGLTAQTIRRIEGGQSDVTVHWDTANILAGVFGLDALQLFYKKQLTYHGRPPRTKNESGKQEVSKKVCNECFIQNPSHLDECSSCGNSLAA